MAEGNLQAIYQAAEYDENVESTYIDITQGLDARLLTAKNIELINELKIKTLHFAWDNPRDGSIKSALQNFRKLSRVKDRRKLAVYVPVNYRSNRAEDLYRIYWLGDNGFEPYVMVYDKNNAPKKIKKFNVGSTTREFLM